jgi:hypothetical protein
MFKSGLLALALSCFAVPAPLAQSSNSDRGKAEQEIRKLILLQ